ncbi:hypothetical protein RRG08_017806 [Elysia crispata]|uniref:Uncharacterized protein n=1 Tax=Elysia crispata TaxID=231223 RepID=A0AAE1CXM1_9GAST|nr:hypothetical protein RRG08_017806 [Elysia crispata]
MITAATTIAEKCCFGEWVLDGVISTLLFADVDVADFNDPHYIAVMFVAAACDESESSWNVEMSRPDWIPAVARLC